MAPQLSIEMRENIVYWYMNEGLQAAEVALLAHCSEASVYEVVRLYQEFGQVTNPYTRPRGRPRTLDQGDITYIEGLLDATSHIFLDEIHDRLLNARGIDVSLATLSRTLRRLDMSRKGVSAAARERDELLHATWQTEYGGIPMEYFVWLDESSVDDRTNQRREGWAPRGRACVRRETFIRGQRFSVLPALSVDGVIALDIFEGSVTKERFLQFVRQDLAPKLTPYPGPRSVVVLDNCAIHHDEEVRQVIEVENGAKLIYLPPYSPDYNPIEQAFHSIKSWLRCHTSEAINAAVRPWLIHQASLSITSDDALGWIMNCGYS